MSQKTSRLRKKAKAASGLPRRRERRFATSTTYMAPWVAAVGMLGALTLGAGVFGLWILDPPLDWASYLVAAGGLGLGASLWFGPRETAVAVGDGGVAVEDGREVIRVPWHALTALTVQGDSVVARSARGVARFSLGANRLAAAWAFKECAERTPGALDVPQALAQKLPRPEDGDGVLGDVVDDQVAGRTCKASDTPIHLEEEARLCARCGQVYHVEHVPERCVTCDVELKGRVLVA
jgi:hypothetical protein